MLPKLQKKKSPGISFSDLIWFSGYTPNEIQFIAAKNQFVCMCYLESTPVTHALFFHQKTKHYA